MTAGLPKRPQAHLAVCLLQACGFFLRGHVGREALMINLSVIKNIKRLKKCAAGMVITGTGSKHLLFVVIKGEVGVYTDYKFPGSTKTAVLGPGDLFVDSALLQDKKTLYTTVAQSESIILPVDKQNAVEFIQEEPALALELLKELSARYDSIGAAYKALTGQTFQHSAQPMDNGVPAAPENGGAAAPEPAPQPQKGAASKTDGAPQAGAAGKPVSAPQVAGLFPEGHGLYSLKLCDPESPYLMTKSFTCPVCGGGFTASVVRPSKLVVTATDPDLRNYYKDIEPLYYEVLTCPHCLYSALQDVFDKPDKKRPAIQEALEAVRDGVQISLGPDKTTETVFAGYYLALYCAPFCFDSHRLLMGRLMYKLSRVYRDAGDEALEKSTAGKALEHFLHVYSTTSMPQSQEQQLCINIAELYFKQNEYNNAVTFFAKARSLHCTPALKNHINNRIYDVRTAASEKR
jgi:uncharacterized protein (DUF2225 family)